VFFETPQAIRPQSLIAIVIHASLSNLEFYLMMSNLYILLVMNIDMEFQHLATKCDGLLESNWNIFDEKQDLEALVNQFKAANEKDFRTIQGLEQQFHEADALRL
jgi:hypothetical protein